MNENSSASDAKPLTVYLDLTHLGRHVTGIERIAIELFEKQRFDGAVLKPVRSSGVLSMVLRQQILLPLLALFNPSAQFVFPGFPPSPLFVFARNRTSLYVHDLFLVTRRADLSTKAKLYMAWPFKIAVTKLKKFLVNSEKTRAELQPFVSRDATITLYRPSVRNVFDLATRDRAALSTNTKISVVSVGTVEPRKNYGAAVAIVERLNARHPGGAELHIAGRSGWGPDAERLQTLPHVKVHGFLPGAEIKRLIESADCYLCTSHDEGLGLPLLEAQYSGLPVVAPDQTVFREVLGSSATFIDPSQADEAASEILRRLQAPGEAHTALNNVARWNGQAAEDAARILGSFAASDKRVSASPRPAVERS